MAFALARENEAFIARMIRIGRFTNQSEVVREALRRMKREEVSYLNPEPLNDDDAKRIYAPNLEEDARELAMGRAALRSIRRLRKGK